MKTLRRPDGFTLVEVLVTISVGAIVMLMIMGIMLPITRTWARYTEKEANTVFLSYVRQSLTERIRYADEIAVLDRLNPLADSEYLVPDAEGAYSIDEYFKLSPRKPNKNCRLEIYMPVPDGNILTLNLSITRDGEVIDTEAFSVAALNLQGGGITYIEDIQGEQAILIR